jgi:hypothetical protein
VCVGCGVGDGGGGGEGKAPYNHEEHYICFVNRVNVFFIHHCCYCT